MSLHYSGLSPDSGITPGDAWGPYGVPEIKLGSGKCKACLSFLISRTVHKMTDDVIMLAKSSILFKSKSKN